MKAILKNTRLAFPAIFSAKAFGEGEPAFSAAFIIDPESKAIGTKGDPKYIPSGKETIAALEATIEAVAKEKWGAKAETVLKGLRASGKVCLRDGADKSQYDGFDGNMYLAARNGSRPLVLDRDKTPLVEADGKPYGGCYVNGNVEIWAQDNQYGKRVNATLKAVQFYRDGDSFGGGGSPADPDDFDDLSEGADADGLV